MISSLSLARSLSQAPPPSLSRSSSLSLLFCPPHFCSPLPLPPMGPNPPPSPPPTFFATLFHSVSSCLLSFHSNPSPCSHPHPHRSFCIPFYHLPLTCPNTHTHEHTHASSVDALALSSVPGQRLGAPLSSALPHKSLHY